MATLGQTIYERMLAKQQADQVAAREQARFDQQNNQNLWQQGLQEQELGERKKQAEFDRQFKVAQALGQSAAYRGEAAPQMRSDVSQEYADIGNAQGGYDFSKFLQEQAQKQSEVNAKLGIANLEHTDKVDQRAFERDQKQSLQDDSQDFDWKKLLYTQGQENYRAGLSANSKNSDQVFSRTNALGERFEHQQVYKDTQGAASAYTKIKNASDDGAGDLALTYSFIKMLDSLTGVREGETAMLATVGSLKTQLEQQYNRLFTDKSARLLPETRAKFINQARQLFEDQYSRYKPMEDAYKGFATKNGLDPSQVVFDYGFDKLVGQGGKSSVTPVGRSGPPPEIIEGLKRDAAAGDIRAIQALEELKLGR